LPLLQALLGGIEPLPFGRMFIILALLSRASGAGAYQNGNDDPRLHMGMTLTA
jgi:hypothetical protein